jgi:cytochrome P450
MLGFLQWLLRRDALLRALKPAFGRFHPFLPEHRRDPQTTWRALRETAPLYRSRMFGTYLCTRYDDVLHVLRDPSFSTDRSQVPAMRVINRLTRREPDFAGLIERNLLTMDGDEHRRLRGLVSKAFTPRRVEQLRPTSVWAPSSRSSRRRWRSAPSCDASRISPERPSLRPGGAR